MERGELIPKKVSKKSGEDFPCMSPESFISR